MKAVDDVTRQIIRDGGFDATYSTDLMYDGERRLSGLRFAGEPGISWDMGRFVACSGSVRVTYADVFGKSVIPREIGDAFSPFGAELQVDLIVRAGRHSARIPMSRLVVTGVPDAVDRRVLFQGARVAPAEVFTLNVSDRLVKVARDEFPFPTAATSTSAWSETQSVTGFPIIRSVDDATVPAGLAYEGRKEPIVNKLFDVMEAWPHVTSDGVLTGMPKAWGDPVDEIRGVISAPVTMSADETYNVVIVEGKSSTGEPIYAMADVTEGFLRVRNTDGGMSPFGQKPYRYSSDLLTTQEACQRYAVELLSRVSRIRGVTRTVVEPFNPLREIGDVLSFDGGVVRVRTLTHRSGQTQMTVEVPDQ